MFAYKLEDECSIENGFAGRYAIIHKVGDIWWSPGHTVPVVYIRMTKDRVIPQIASEIECCEYIKRTFEPKGSKYKIRLLSTSKSIIPNKKLTFIGNFKGLLTPDDEIKYPNDDLTWACDWRRFEKYVNDHYIETIKGKNH